MDPERGTDIRCTAMADMAAEAATHAHWRDTYNSDIHRMELDIARMESENAELLQQIHSLAENPSATSD